MYPLWALLYFDWELEYGWLEDSNPASVEVNLKQSYKQNHAGKLPAIVDR